MPLKMTQRLVGYGFSNSLVLTLSEPRGQLACRNPHGISFLNHSWELRIAHFLGAQVVALFSNFLVCN